MVDKTHLRDKNVVVRIVGLNRTMGATVSYVENDGIWLTGGDFMNQLAAATGGFPVGIKTPALYVPFSQLQWMVAPND